MQSETGVRPQGAIRLAESQDGVNAAERRMRQLRVLYDRINTRHDFTKGQFVRWKPGLKNRGSPEYGEPVIVMDVMATPIFDTTENSAGSPYFLEPLTLVIGVFREDDLLEFRTDGRRFEPFPET